MIYMKCQINQMIIAIVDMYWALTLATPHSAGILYAEPLLIPVTAMVGDAVLWSPLNKQAQKG